MSHPCPPCHHPSCCHPRVCLACHGDRLASLLETASAFRVYRFESPDFVEEGVWPMPTEGMIALGNLLARAGVVLLVCGGATCCCVNHIIHRGVAVAPWIAGDVPTVLTALRHNQLESLLAPGARFGRGRARRIGRSMFDIERHETPAAGGRAIEQNQTNDEKDVTHGKHPGTRSS